MMKSTTVFQSALADAMSRFVAFKGMNGYDYSGRSVLLKRFDRFLEQYGCPDGLLSMEIFRNYAATIAHLAPGTQLNLLSAVRTFSRWLHAYRNESRVLPVSMLPDYRDRTRFYRIEPEQVGSLMDATSMLRSPHSVRAPCMRFLIGLLYSTGLRVNEALKLNLADVDVHQATLYVRKGKFHKDRLISLSRSSCEALNDWLQLRAQYGSNAKTAPLLLGAYNKRLTYGQAKCEFRKLCRHCGLEGQSPPRLHDLRHNYACHCIARWRENGQDVQALLPVLAQAMGHVSIFTTQVYIHLDAGTLQDAGSTFRNHFTKNQKEKD